MYIRGLIPRNFAELAEEVPIDIGSVVMLIRSASVICLFVCFDSLHLSQQLYSHAGVEPVLSRR